MLNFQKTEVEADIYGTVYNLRRPTVKEAQDYANKAKKATDEEQVDFLIEMLSDCGLPNDVSQSMEPDHLVQLMNTLIPSKKK